MTVKINFCDNLIWRIFNCVANFVKICSRQNKFPSKNAEETLKVSIWIFQILVGVFFSAWDDFLTDFSSGRPTGSARRSQCFILAIDKRFSVLLIRYLGLLTLSLPLGSKKPVPEISMVSMVTTSKTSREYRMVLILTIKFFVLKPRWSVKWPF